MFTSTSDSSFRHKFRKCRV